MKCQLCRRELTATETVWRYYDAQIRGVLSICDECFYSKERTFRDNLSARDKEFWGNWFEDYLQKTWREPLPCERCGRPVRTPRRHKLKLIVCGKSCRVAIFNAQARMRRALAPRACVVCGQSFTPKRSDSRYCSVGCKQSAYRRRNVATTLP